DFETSPKFHRAEGIVANAALIDPVRYDPYPLGRHVSSVAIRRGERFRDRNDARASPSNHTVEPGQQARDPAVCANALLRDQRLGVDVLDAYHERNTSHPGDDEHQQGREDGPAVGIDDVGPPTEEKIEAARPAEGNIFAHPAD